jgi:hypothetical protein
MNRAIILCLLLVAGLAIRSRDITQPIVRFHPTRHYRSAVLARACYYDHASGIPDWARRVANAARAMQQAGEPELMEAAACAAYLAIGHENVTIPRVLAVVIWVSGAIPLLMLAARLASPLAAWLAVALYLFLPYGIVASRNFQPDQLMTVTSIWALVALVRHYDRPTRSRFVVAGLAVSVAGFVKPMSVFVTLPVLITLELLRDDQSWARRFIAAARLMLLGMLLPLIFYGYTALFGTLIQDQGHMRFVPHLIPTIFFWGGLSRMIARVETWPLLILAVVGMAVARDRVARWVLSSLFAGYFAFAIGFTYHVPTHDYYHLPYIPVTALGVAVLLARVETLVPKRAPVMVAAALCVIAIAIGSMRAWPRLHFDGAAAMAKNFEEIGALAEHDTHVLFLDPEYGYSMMYHAQISGDSWPNVDDLAAEMIDERENIGAEERFERYYAGSSPTYFVITDLGSLAAEKDLQELLAKRTTPVRITSDYRVYKFTRVN